MPFRFFLLLAVFGLCVLPVQAQTVPSTRAQMDLTFAPLVKQVAPAVVNIYTKRVVTTRDRLFSGDPLFDQMFAQGFGFGVPRARVENSLGSGVIVAADGLVVTNAHVVQGAEEIVVVLRDGREFDARISVLDTPSDVALLRLNDVKGDLPSAALKTSDGLEVGDLVLAIGNPFGVGQTVTSGIISALASSAVTVNDFNFFIQTDAAINPGNSGGPLVSMDGHVIGINSAIFSKTGGSLGIGFAIPAEMVLSVMAAEKTGAAQLSPTGQVKRAWFGVTVQNLTGDIASSLGLNANSGALVSALHPQSPLRKAGLVPGDVVTGVAGHKVKDGTEIKFRLATIPIGQDVAIDIIRKNGERETVTLTSHGPPDTPARQETVIKGQNPLAGAVIANINPAVAHELSLPDDTAAGVAVLRVEKGGMAARLVKPGTVLLEINGQKIETVRDVQKAVQAVTRQGWVAKLLNGGQVQTIVLR